MFGALMQILAFLFEFFEPPYPAFAVSFTLAGMGNIFQVNNIHIHKELQLIISLLDRSRLHLRMASSQLFKRTLISNRAMYRLHMVHFYSPIPQSNTDSSLGVGALAAPLSATYFAQLETQWSRHYLVSLSIAISNMVILASVFKFQPQDGTFMAHSEIRHRQSPLIITVCLRQAGEIHPDKIPGEEIQENKFSQLMKNKNVHLFAFFIMVYTGIEITIGGIIHLLR